MSAPDVATVRKTRIHLQTAMSDASPPVTQRELAKALEEIDGKVRSATYLGFVLQGREDQKPHVAGYLDRCQEALRLVAERREAAALALAEV